MARAAAKVAVSVDGELLARAEQRRKVTGESRSALVARALRQLLRTEEHAQQVEQYVAAYRSVPEGATEIRAARSLARRSLRALPWTDR